MKERDYNTIPSLKWNEQTGWNPRYMYPWDSTVGRTIWTFLPYYLLYEDMEYGIDRDQFTINLQYVSTYMWMQIHKFIITYYI